jgi:phage terminase small subunit
MGNLVKLNEKHEEFALEYLFGAAKGNAARAYANVYYNGDMAPSCYSSGSKLLQRQDVKSYLDVKMEEHKAIIEYKRIHNSQMLSDIADEMLHAQPTDHNGNPISTHLCRQTAIKAISELNKMHGFNEDKADLTVNGGFNFTFNLVPPSDEDDAAIKAEMDAIRSESGDIAEDIDFEEFE